jgi:hypothetical protein
VTAHGGPSPNTPANSLYHLENYWSIIRSNVSGDMSVTAFYNSVNGDAESLRHVYWNGHKWMEQQTGGNPSSKSIQVKIPEGRGEIFAFSDPSVTRKAIAVAPNPVAEVAIVYLNVPADGTTVLRVIDANGKVVASQRVNLRRGSNRVEMSVAGMAGGKYSVVATSPEKTYTAPMIKK